MKIIIKNIISLLNRNEIYLNIGISHSGNLSPYPNINLIIKDIFIEYKIKRVHII